jgi:hypothetical protein
MIDADGDLIKVADELLRLDPDGSRWASVLRHTYDVVYNGQETGRFRWDDLLKTEKTHFGTLFEIFGQREFQFMDGDTTDFRISGVQVDAKWSQKDGGWMLPPEVFGEIALVATANDQKSIWSLGLIRVEERFRREGSNRDKKSQLNLHGRENIHWLWRDEPLPSNVLLKLDASQVKRMQSLKSGTERVAELFRLGEGRLVNRASILTIAKQLDAMRRLRGGSGGARQVLAPEGYLILSGAYHSNIARAFGILVPSNSEFISHRIVPDDSGIQIAGQTWRLARSDECRQAEAPVLPLKWIDLRRADTPLN